MIKRNNRKGFTIVELVIVIAVIAILAGVLIPKFSGIVKKAKENAALQEVKTAYTTYLSETLIDSKEDTLENKYYVFHKNTHIVIEDGSAKIVESKPTGYIDMEIVASTKGNGKTLKAPDTQDTGK